MDEINTSTISLLDRRRINSGIDNFKTYYRDLMEHNPEKAIELINDENLHFSSLFILQPEIKGNNRSANLNSRNKHALDITNGILLKKSSHIEQLTSNDRQLTYSVLKWILETGYIDDGMNNQYDQVLETSAVLLIKTYKDKTTLHRIVEMIFKRYKKGLFIYDLVWAFFECRDPYSLILIATRLCSTQWKDVELARKLLNFIPCIRTKNNIHPTYQYLCCVNWIRENSAFLHYIGEGFQQTCKPFPYVLSLEAKYLCKPMTLENDKASSPLTEVEQNLLKKFNKLDSATKTLLSNYSYLLYRQNPYQWNVWLRYPIWEQIKVAITMEGGLS